MESNIILLSEDTDQATKQMLQHLIERKRKLNYYQRTHKLFLLISIIYTLCVFYFINRFIIVPYSYSLYELFTLLVNNTKYLYTILLSVGLFGVSNILFNKKEKYEKEYHELRCEIIDRSKDLWKGDAWKNRHKVFQMMKKNYDINLYHESK